MVENILSTITLCLMLIALYATIMSSLVKIRKNDTNKEVRYLAISIATLAVSLITQFLGIVMEILAFKFDIIAIIAGGLSIFWLLINSLTLNLMITKRLLEENID